MFVVEMIVARGDIEHEGHRTQEEIFVDYGKVLVYFRVKFLCTSMVGIHEILGWVSDND